MKRLRKRWLLVMVVLLCIGGLAYARTESVVTHTTVIVLPRQEETPSTNNEMERASIVENSKEPVAKIEEIETPDGQKTLYTMVGIL